MEDVTGTKNNSLTINTSDEENSMTIKETTRQVQSWSQHKLFIDPTLWPKGEEDNSMHMIIQTT
jgi:hypothetical protein